MDCRNTIELHGHSHDDHNHGGHDGHDHDHVPPPDTYASQSLHRFIYHDHIRTLNESERNSGQAIVKTWENRLDTTKILESDVDEELLINIPFTGLVRIYSLLVRTTTDEFAPKTIKLFKNRDDLDFSSASETKPTATLTHPEGFGIDPESDSASNGENKTLDEQGIAEYSLNRAHFSNVSSLTVYISENYGEETTKILYLGLRGECTNANTKAPVITLYEAAANPKDHKNMIAEESKNFQSI